MLNKKLSNYFEASAIDKVKFVLAQYWKADSWVFMQYSKPPRLRNQL